MSNTGQVLARDCECIRGCEAIELLIRPRDADLGGFSVRRVLPIRQRKMVGPWIFFDHMGPADFAPGEGIDVRPHPHVGLATVTYLFEGEIVHRDSLGSLQAIRPGDLNLMVAGSGIVHSEREPPNVKNSAHRQHGLQLWLALPEAVEEIEPAFYHYPDAELPRLEVGGVAVRVMMGSAYGVTSPVVTYADTLYVEAHLRAGQRIVVPEADERAVYTVEGAVDARGTELAEHAMAVLDDTREVVLEAKRDSRIAVIGGERLSDRYIEWNFVSSRKERLERAKAQWRAQAFSKVPGDEETFIPLPD